MFDGDDIALVDISGSFVALWLTGVGENKIIKLNTKHKRKGTEIYVDYAIL